MPHYKSPYKPQLQKVCKNILYKKSRIREKKNLLTDADSRTDTILEGLHYFFIFFFLDKSRNLSKIVSVLRSASVERFDVSRMRDFLDKL